jgi:hypothetical protein
LRKPRFLLIVSSDPPGAQISIDGSATGMTTPVEFELTPAQAAKKSVRVVLRKPGFRVIDRTIDFAKFKFNDGDGDTQMIATLDEKLAVAPMVTGPPSGWRSLVRARQPSPDIDSDTDSDLGSAPVASGRSTQGGTDDDSTATHRPPRTHAVQRQAIP